MRRHRHQEFIRFLNAVERAVPAEESHPPTSSTTTKWLEHHPRWTFHFAPTSASWLKVVEGFFATHTSDVCITQALNSGETAGGKIRS
jgi:hypothetical protein